MECSITDDGTLSNLIEISINIQYDERAFTCTYEVHTRSDTAITVTSSQQRRVREPHGRLVAYGGHGISLVSRAIGAVVERIILRGTDVEVDESRDTSIPPVTALKQFGRVREECRMCTVNFKLDSES